MSVARGVHHFLRPLQSLTAHGGVMLLEGGSQTLIREDTAADDQSALQVTLSRISHQSDKTGRNMWDI